MPQKKAAFRLFSQIRIKLVIVLMLVFTGLMAQPQAGHTLEYRFWSVCPVFGVCVRLGIQLGTIMSYPQLLGITLSVTSHKGHLSLLAKRWNT